MKAGGVMAKIDKLVDALFQRDVSPYYQYLNKYFKNKKKSLYRYVPIDMRELKDVNNKTDKDIKSILMKDYQFGVNSLINNYLYHNSPKFFNDPFDCVFGIGFDSLFRELILSMADRNQLKGIEKIENQIPKNTSIENIHEVINELDVDKSIKTFLNTSIDITKLMLEEGIDFNENPDLAQKVFMQHMLTHRTALHGMLTPFMQEHVTPEQFNELMRQGQERYLDQDFPVLDLLNPNISEFKKLATNENEKSEFDNVKTKLVDMIQQINEKIFNLIDDKFGVIALTSLKNDPLMWSHYADSHRGFCIEYDFENYLKVGKNVKSLIFPIDYSKIRVSIDENILDKVDIRDFKGNGKEDITKLFVRGLYSKHTSWKIEKEWRSISVLKENTIEARKIESFKVKSVSFGNKMNDRIKRVLYELIHEKLVNGPMVYEMVNEMEHYSIKRVEYKK